MALVDRLVARQSRLPGVRQSERFGALRLVSGTRESQATPPIAPWQMQLLLPAAYTAIALGFVDSFSAARPRVVRVWSPSKSTTYTLRSPPALRSLYHPRGLFCLSYVHPESQHIRWVVCKKKRALSSSPFPPLTISLLPSLSSLTFLPLSSFCLFSSFANEDDKTTLSAPREAPGRSKWRWRSCVALLASSCAIRCSWTRDFYVSLSFADPFADAIKGSDDDVQDGLVHIRIQQRNGRKTLTTVQGLSSEYDLKKIVRACKKVSERASERATFSLEISVVVPFSYPSTYLPTLSTLPPPLSCCPSLSTISHHHSLSLRQNSKNRSDANNCKVHSKQI